MFYGIDPKIPNEMYRAIEEGFRSPSEYERMGMGPHVALVNSIFSADSQRITACLKAESYMTHGKDDSLSLLSKINSIPSGYILVWKVFYPGPQFVTIEQKKESNKQQKTWYVLDPSLILPEYLVEFEYSTEAKEEAKENTVNLEMKAQKNKEVAKIFEATIEAQKILQNTYLNPQVKEGVKGTSFHIIADDLDRSDMGCMK